MMVAFIQALGMTRTRCGAQVMIIAHSMGMIVELSFGKWAEHQEPGWYAEHVAGVINIAGPVLGLPKVTDAVYRHCLSPLLGANQRGLEPAVFQQQHVRAMRPAGIGSFPPCLIAPSPCCKHLNNIKTD